MSHFVRNSLLAATALMGLSALPTMAAPATAETSVAAKPAPARTHSLEGNVEQRILSLHAKLQITPQQEPHWVQFATVMRDNARAMDMSFQRRVQTMPTMTAPENMASYAQVSTEHAQQMQRLGPAFQVLYDSMTDIQKKGADQVFRDDAHRGPPMMKK